jgi:hypothetical protein
METYGTLLIHFVRNVPKITRYWMCLRLQFRALQFSYYSLNQRVLTVLLDLYLFYKKHGLLGPKHVAVSGFCNIIVNMIQLCAFLGTN